MSNSKTPGIDGLPKEFYTFAFKYIGKAFVRLINRCDGEGMLPPSQRQGLITLICKDKNNAETLKNWRPISLLNVDYKMLSKVLTLRLRKVIGEIIHPDQTCSIPGRTIQDNIHLIRNVIEYSNSKNISAAIISLDQSKAFDRVSHDYLINTLNAFGFKPHFISLTKLLYTKIFSKVLVNGHISESFTIGRSVRQGCSMSPLLYVLCMEAFAHRIRTDPMIEGIPLPGTTEVATVSQYADDTNLFITKVNSVHHILKIVDAYEQASGALLNKENTFGMWLGRWRGRTDQPENIHWSSDHHKFYGISLGTEQSERLTWNKIVCNLDKRASIYSGRDLSYRGISVVAQVILCTSIWYIGSLLLMPASIRRKIERIIFTFVWTNQHEALKRNTVYNSFDKGDLNITDIKTKLDAFLVKQVIQLINGHEAKWTFFAIYWLGLHIRQYVPAYASLSIPHAEKIPQYYKYALLLFRKFETLSPQFMNQGKITITFIYSKLLQPTLVEPGCITIYPTINFTQVWPRIQSEFVDRNYRDLAWRIAHHILPTQSLLHRYHISDNAKCYLCKQAVESISHLFYECNILKGLWHFVELLIFKLTGSRVTITLNAIRFLIFQTHPYAKHNEL